MNKAILIGYLGADPETRSVNGDTVCNMRLATTDVFNKKDGSRGERTDAIPPMFLAYEEDFVPMEGAHNGDSDVDSWAYGRSDPNEYFAEMYTKAANLPELLYQDLVGEPEAMVEAAHLGGDPMAARLAEAAEHKRAQWDVMRQEVFGVTDALVEDRVADLEALHGWADDGATRELTQAFREDAQRVATPDQLERLLDSYLRAGS